MNSNMQMLSLFISFIYGIFFYFLTILNFKIINNLRVIIQHVITFIYTLDMTIIYIVILYHLNKGYFHIYFIFMVFLGFIMALYLYNKILSKINVKHIFKN